MKTLQQYATRKPFQCNGCNSEKEWLTNHYGEVYDWCSVCCNTVVWNMTDEIPEGFTTPAKWRLVKLEDLEQIK